MPKFYLIRHGEPDYSYGDEHGFIGQGHDLAPLKKEKIIDVIRTSKDERLKGAKVIVSSPYTRALQTAAIISKETGLNIEVDMDLREWQPDLTYRYKSKDEMEELYRDFKQCGGKYPQGEEKKWESEESLKKRAMSVIEKYKKYDCVIIVGHKMLFKTITNTKGMEPAEILELNI